MQIICRHHDVKKGFGDLHSNADERFPGVENDRVLTVELCEISILYGNVLNVISHMKLYFCYKMHMQHIGKAHKIWTDKK